MVRTETDMFVNQINLHHINHHHNNLHHLNLHYYNRHYYTPLQPSTNLQLVLFQIVVWPKDPDTTHRHQIFYSRCSIKNKVCNFIIDNESCENIISSTLVDYLNLETEPHRILTLLSGSRKAFTSRKWIFAMFLFQIARFIKISLLVMLSIWMHVTYFCRDHGNMMLTLPIKVKRISMCSLKRVKELPWGKFHLPQILQKEEEPKFIFICNQGESLVDSKETKRDLLY